MNVIDGMLVRDLANQLSMKVAPLLKVIQKCAQDLGLRGTITQVEGGSAVAFRRHILTGSPPQDTRLDAESAATISMELDHEFVVLPGHAKDLMPRPDPADTAALQPRAPVVTIMGHVDHGKTTLLDTLRNASVAAGEAGGITQHIGAFTVKMKTGKKISFLDTPGHAAFSGMRARGASVTDIVVLVVAATDGVRPQTLESIKFARAAGVPLVVAVNKIDADGADTQMTKASLDKAGVYIEENGGDTQVIHPSRSPAGFFRTHECPSQCVEISALKGINMEELEDAIVTAAEMEGLWADPSGLAEGYVLEAKTVKGQGAVTTVLVKRGTLKPGSIVVAGTSLCKVRQMRGQDGKPQKCAGPSEPVEITGWRTMPEVGDMLLAATDEKRAREAVE